MPAEFVIYSLRHTYGTRLGKAGAAAFSIMRLMGHSSITVSQRYVHPSAEALERAGERLQEMNVAPVRIAQEGAERTAGLLQFVLQCKSHST